MNVGPTERVIQILSMTRGEIRARVGDRSVTIEGEAFLRGYGSPDFVIYPKMLRAWDPPHEKEPLEEETKASIFEEIKQLLAERGVIVEVDNPGARRLE
jgi:hypothetical protein